MRASSPILDSVQRPTTILGIPPKMFVATLGLSMLMLPIMAFLPVAGTLFWVALLVGGMAAGWRLRTRDPHIEELWQNGLAFWRRGHGWWCFWRAGRKGDCRVLCAGGPQ